MTASAYPKKKTPINNLAKLESAQKFHDMARVDHNDMEVTPVTTYKFNDLLLKISGKQFQREHFSACIKAMNKRINDLTRQFRASVEYVKDAVFSRTPAEYRKTLLMLVEWVYAHTVATSNQISIEGFQCERILELEAAVLQEKLENLSLMNEIGHLRKVVKGNLGDVYPLVENWVLSEKVCQPLLGYLLVFLCVLTHSGDRLTPSKSCSLRSTVAQTPRRPSSRWRWPVSWLLAHSRSRSWRRRSRSSRGARWPSLRG